MSLFPWSFCVCPNAGVPRAHIGHLWSFAHTRWWYELARNFERLQFPGCLDVHWNVAFDHGAKPECEGAYLELLDWMGCRPDAVHRLKDWFALTDSKQPHTYGYPFVKRICGLPEASWPCEHNGQPYLYKMLYWNATNVYWHIRGQEHAASQMRIVEEVAAQYLPPLRMPLMFYHPLLLDDAGVKIDAVKLTPCHEITPDLRAHPATEVLAAVIRSLGFKAVIDRNLPPDRALVGLLGQFHMHTGSLYIHSLMGTPLRVPNTWKEFME